MVSKGVFNIRGKGLFTNIHDKLLLRSDIIYVYQLYIMVLHNNDILLCL